ncbi:hypothetical protein L1987_09099 [Smallanthus sonchifolius]|uniref:Uncharacterized protein n=1 Tax=Smallanthus sonchifolius TaxID=185202 RepID=A0ACB9JP25_9ASTR|nr:hypothetical protein L1987_09099 [Smallanthus sonchifolius]
MNMLSANTEPEPLQPIVSDDEGVQEEPDQVLESEPEEESEEELVGVAEGANSDIDLGETLPYSVMHGEDTRSEEVRPPTPSPPRLPSPMTLHNEWVNFMVLARHRTARKTVLLLKKMVLPSLDTETLLKRHCPSSQREIGEPLHPVRPREVGSIEQIRPPNIGTREPQEDPGAQQSDHQRGLRCYHRST